MDDSRRKKRASSKRVSDIDPPEPWPEPGAAPVEGERLVKPKPALAHIIGKAALPRTEVVGKLWSYAKKKGLQDKKNKRMVNTDDRLKALFGNKSSVTLNEMTRLISKHLA